MVVFPISFRDMTFELFSFRVGTKVDADVSAAVGCHLVTKSGSDCSGIDLFLVGTLLCGIVSRCQLSSKNLRTRKYYVLTPKVHYHRHIRVCKSAQHQDRFRLVWASWKIFHFNHHWSQIITVNAISLISWALTQTNWIVRTVGHTFNEQVFTIFQAVRVGLSIFYIWLL